MNRTNRSMRSNPAVARNLIEGGILLSCGGLAVVASVISLLTTLVFWVLRIVSNQVVALNFYFSVPVSWAIFALLLGVCLFVLGGRRFSLNSRYKKLLIQLNAAPTNYLESIATQLKREAAFAMKDIVILQKKGYFRALTVLENAVILEPFEPNIAYKVLASKGFQFAQTEARSRLPYPISLLLTTAVPLLATLPLRWLWVIAGVLLSFVVYSTSAVFTRPRLVVLYQTIPDAKSVPIKVERSGNQAVDTVLAQGEEYLNELTSLQSQIKNDIVLGNLYDISASLRQVIDLIAKEPAKIRQVERLMNYSLPTSLKLLVQYVYLSDQSIKGENILSSMAKIEGMTNNLANTIRRELDQLYQDKSLDIEVDVEVLEQMLVEDNRDINS